jgi:hypothetical protein
MEEQIKQYENTSARSRTKANPYESSYSDANLANLQIYKIILCWQQFSIISHSSKDMSDIIFLTNLFMDGLSEEQKMQFAQSIELSNLVQLEPKVMHQNMAFICGKVQY